MTTPASKDDWLAEARAYCEQADPGPWEWTAENERGVDLIGSACPILFAVNIPPEDPTPLLYVSHANQPLLARCRVDLPRAIAALEAADALHSIVDEYFRDLRGEGADPDAVGWVKHMENIAKAIADYLAARYGGTP